MSNLTQEQGLIVPITDSGWFSRPAGREGYEVVVLEKVGNGNRYYMTLLPGQSLRLGEVVFGKFNVYAVDIRYGRAFPVTGQFMTQERNQKVTLNANVRYRVTDSRQVALGTADPLQEIKNRVIDALRRNLSRYPHNSVNESLCVDTIRSVGAFPHLGLVVEGAEILEFSPEGRTLGYRTETEEQEHKLRLELRSTVANIDTSEMRERSRMSLDEEKIQRFDLRDPNVFMHVRPDMVPAVLEMVNQREQVNLAAKKVGVEMIAKALDMYIKQKRDAGEEFISLDEVTNYVRENLLSGTSGPTTPDLRISFGRESSSQTIDAQVLPASSQITFGNDEESTPSKGKKQDTGPRIQFGD